MKSAHIYMLQSQIVGGGDPTRGTSRGVLSKPMDPTGVLSN